MLLATRCPHCETVFRLQQAQLSLHGGLVRCGHCQQVFNAADSLVEGLAQPEPALAEAGEVAEAGSASAPHVANVPRLFRDPPADSPAHADFTPDNWDMWAPWLDGGIDPSLQHNGRNVSAEPLVPVTLPESGATPANEMGIARLIRPSQAESGAASTAREATEPAQLSPLASIHDPREPRFAGDDRPESFGAAPAVDDLPHSTAAPNAIPAREPRFADDARYEPDDARHEPASPYPDGDMSAPPSVTRDPHFAAGAQAEPFAAVPDNDDSPPFAVTREARTPRQHGLLGGFVGGLVASALAVLLVMQLAWWQRETVMIHWPVTQGWFQRLCTPLGCSVAPPRAIDGLRLDATDLRQLDGPHTLELKAPLTNRYRVALAYPSIELTLLDDTNHVTVRRVLAPRDYVRPGTPIEAGLPARATQTMIVRVETHGAPASNFRVQIFYP